MADFPGEGFTSPAPFIERDFEPLVGEAIFPTGGGVAVVNYHQRVYDTVLAQWCYYTKTVVDPAPLPGETTPNHTGNLLAGAHDIILIS